jgi:autotransporter-associated beta strand protein
VNHIYRLIWSKSRQAFVVAAETSSAKGKSASARHLSLPAVALTLAGLTPINALALNECGAGTTVVCDNSGVPASNANPYANGISYTGQNVNLTLASGAVINTSTGTPPATNGPTTVGIGVGIPALTTVAGNASITVDAGATVLISQTAVHGLVIAGKSTSSPSTGTVVNNGTVSFTGAAGGRSIYVETNGDVSVTNSSTGVLDGAAQFGIYARDAGENHKVNVTNNGQISSTWDRGGASAILLSAAGATGSGSLVQTGTISTNGTGVTMTVGSGAGSLGTFENSGSISGGFGGVSLSGRNAAAQLIGTNSGSITAREGYGLQNGLGVVDFTNTGTIVGKTAGVLRDFAGTLTNSGTITGTSGTAISVNGANNALIFTDGSVLNGDVVSTSAGNTILLKGSNTEDSNFTGFDSLTMAGTNWTLGGTVSTTGTTATATNVQAGTLVVAGSLINGGIGGGTTIAPGGTLQLGTGGTTGSISGAVDVGDGGTLAVRRSDAVTLGNALTGTGLLDVDTQGEAFDFGANAGSAFAGTVGMGNSMFQLGDLNTASLENATLRAGAGSQVRVADGIQTIGGLSIQGGTLAFNAGVPDQRVAVSTIRTGLLDASGTGTIAVNVPTPYTLAVPDTPNSTNLLAQDDGNIGTRLIEADSVQGSGGALALVDQDGNVLSDGHSVDIAQGGSVVARGDYDYRVSTAPGDGLYVNYGLTALDLMDGQTLTLAPDTTAGAVARAAASDMSARISGQGNLAVDAGAGRVSLSNATNAYTGATQVDSGTLRLDADNALGNTRLLALAGGSSAEINGSAQTIGAIDVQSGASLDLGGGSLSLADGGRSAGTLTGTGKLAVSGGTLLVQGTNESLAADVAIADGATVQLDSAVGLGTGGIANDGQMTFNGANDGAAFSNALVGNGIVYLQGQSNLAATGDNSGYTGTFEIDDSSTLTAADAQNLGTAAIIDDGELIIANASDSVLANAISGAGNVTKQGAGVLSVAESLTYTGATNVNEGVLRAGQANAFSRGSTHTVATGATLDTGGFNQTVGSLSNAGVVNLASAAAGSTLTIAGNYVGNGGRLVLGTVLGGDDSASTGWWCKGTLRATPG